MPTWGYALIAALIAALAGYVFWPDARPPGVAAFPAAIAAPFTVTGELGEQQIADGRVRVAGLDRRANDRAIASFAAAARNLTADPSRVVDGVDAGAARAWGVDPARRLVAGDEERHWGEADGIGAVYDPQRRRVVLVDATTLRRVALAAARLDQPELVELERDPAWITVDGARLDHVTGRWTFSAARRPPADGRVAELLGALRAARLGEPGALPPGASRLHELTWDQGAAPLRLCGDGTRTWLALEGAPAQVLPAHLAARWRELLASFATDRVADAAPGQALAVGITRAGAEVFRLERRGLVDDAGTRPWWVVWPAGAEPAAAQAGERIDLALRRLAVQGAVQAAEPVGPDATAITVAAEGGGSLRVVLSGGRAWCDGWLGMTGTLPAELAGLRAEAQLDPHLLPVEAQRITKLQRRWPAEPARDEVLTRPSGGSWSRSWPAGATPVDADAAARLVRALARLEARAVRRATPEDRALPTIAELALRVAPVQVRRTGTENDVDLADTVPQEHAWRLVRPAAGGWLAVDVTGGLAYDLDESAAELLLADLASTRIFPVAPALVAAVTVGGGDGFRLARRGDAWTLQRGDAQAPADAIAVRRLLRALAALDAAPATGAPGPGVRIAIETADGESLTAEISAIGNAVLAQTIRGVRRLDAGAWSQVELAPAAYQARP